MAKPTKTGTTLQGIVDLLRETKKGQEAAMYGPLRDLFCDILGYSRAFVSLDLALVSRLKAPGKCLTEIVIDI